MLSKIQIRPGINRDMTSYTNTGGWYDSDFMRFRNGLPEKIGGWTKIYSDQSALIGNCRKLYDWSSLVGDAYLACPTNIKFYVDNSTQILDITPLRRSVPLGTNPITTSTSTNATTTFTGYIIGQTLTVTAIASGAITVGSTVSGTGVTSGTTIVEALIGGDGLASYKVAPSQTVTSTSMSLTTSTITVTDVNHGAVAGDYVTLSGSSAVNGISTSNINKELIVNSVSNANAYSIVVDGTATSSGAGGGSGITAKYQFHPGISAETKYSGWGTGGWGGEVKASFTASISGATMNVTAISSGSISVGDSINGSNVSDNTIVSAFGTGVGGTGTYTVTQSQNVSSTTLTSGYGWGYGPDTIVATYYSGLWSVDNYGEDMVACPRNVVNGTKFESNALATSANSSTVTVTQVNHGLSNGTAVIIGGVTNDIGGISKLQLNGSHVITVINANAYSFVASSNASSSTSGGFGAYSYLSSLIYWDITDTDGPAISFSELGSAYAKKYMPYVAVEILVSDQNRQVIALGSNPFDVTQTQDKMIVRWSDSSDPTNWDSATPENTSGETRLSSGSYIVTAVQNREEILIWTDSSLFSMTYVGPPYGYGFNLVGSNFDIIGPNSKIVAGSVAYWMGSSNFYMYDGKLQTMPCTVRDYVFSDISIADGEKVYCSADSGNNEIIWFYPSESQGGNPGGREPDRYVVYNYVEQSWYYGTMSRTAWIDRRGHANPRAVSTDGYLYNQESGYDDGSTSPPTAIPAYIQSSPIEIQDGENFLFINRVIPDLVFRNPPSDNGAQPVVKFTIKPQDYPGGAIGEGDERDVQRKNSATLKIDRFTDQVFTRLRARSVILRVESDDTGIGWRLGTPRFDMRKDGRR